MIKTRFDNNDCIIERVGFMPGEGLITFDETKHNKNFKYLVDLIISLYEKHTFDVINKLLISLKTKDNKDIDIFNKTLRELNFKGEINTAIKTIEHNINDK